MGILKPKSRGQSRSGRSSKPCWGQNCGQFRSPPHQSLSSGRQSDNQQSQFFTFKLSDISFFSSSSQSWSKMIWLDILRSNDDSRQIAVVVSAPTGCVYGIAVTRVPVTLQIHCMTRAWRPLDELARYAMWLVRSFSRLRVLCFWFSLLSHLILSPGLREIPRSLASHFILPATHSIYVFLFANITF